MGIDRLPPDAPQPRLCHIVKAFPEEEYGFNLHAERGRGQFIGKVDLGSPADQASLRQGDHIIAVNGAPVSGESHKQVVARIKQYPLQTRLLVIDAAGKKWFDENGVALTPDMPYVLCEAAMLPPPSTPPDDDTMRRYGSGSDEEMQFTGGGRTEESATYSNGYSNVENSPHGQSNGHRSYSGSTEPMPLPRLCQLQKSHEGEEFGFNLHAEKGKGHFIGKVDRDSLAEHSGLEEGQRIVGVNGTLIYPTSPHKEVVALVKMHKLRTDLLVASPEVDEYFLCRGLPFSFEELENFVPKSITPPPMPTSSPPLQKIPAQKQEQQLQKRQEKQQTLQQKQSPKQQQIQRSPRAQPKIDPKLQGLDNNDPRSLAPIPVEQQKERQQKSSAPAVTSYEKVDISRQHSPKQQQSPVSQDFSRPSSSASSGYNETILPEPSLKSTQRYSAPVKAAALPEDIDSVLRLSVAEVRDRLSHRKKRDPKHDHLSMKEKYDIIRNL